MPRYIDVDALENEAGKLWDEMPDGEELSKELMKAINHAPTVDAAPVVHGVWKDDRTDIMCTACNERFSDEIVFASLRHWDGEMWMKYCPYCGAKMDLEG
jgi:uncharacterized Zn-finger protein